MSERQTEQDRKLEEWSKRTFDRSTQEIDASTRSRLTQARVRALEELAPGKRFAWMWRAPMLPAGAAAAAALAAWLVLVQGNLGNEPPLQENTFADLEMLLGEEELEMIEELDFYAWLEEQPEFDAAAPEADGGDGVG
jgi:hypothetical protein